MYGSNAILIELFFDIALLLESSSKKVAKIFRCSTGTLNTILDVAAFSPSIRNTFDSVGKRPSLMLLVKPLLKDKASDGSDVITAMLE